MTKEKFEIPTAVDAAILQYAAAKKFKRQRWYWSVPARAAAVALLALGIGYMQFDMADKKVEAAVVTAELDTADWAAFEEKLEFVDDAIFSEANYLAQL